MVEEAVRGGDPGLAFPTGVRARTRRETLTDRDAEEDGERAHPVPEQCRVLPGCQEESRSAEVKPRMLKEKKIDQIASKTFLLQKTPSRN